MERRDQTLPILELPLGPEWDAAGNVSRDLAPASRRLNGVSGYDPPHYAPLQAGLNAHDPAMLAALASLGAIDVVVDGDIRSRRRVGPLCLGVTRSRGSSPATACARPTGFRRTRPLGVSGR